MDFQQQTFFYKICFSHKKEAYILIKQSAEWENPFKWTQNRSSWYLA